MPSLADRLAALRAKYDSILKPDIAEQMNRHIEELRSNGSLDRILKPGQIAPSSSLKDQHGNLVSSNDLTAVNASESWQLRIPSDFVIATDATIVDVEAGSDYRFRPDPEDGEAGIVRPATTSNSLFQGWDRGCSPAQSPSELSFSPTHLRRRLRQSRPRSFVRAQTTARGFSATLTHRFPLSERRRHPKRLFP